MFELSQERFIFPICFFLFMCLIFPLLPILYPDAILGSFLYPLSNTWQNQFRGGKDFGSWFHRFSPYSADLMALGLRWDRTWWWKKVASFIAVCKHGVGDRERAWEEREAKDSPRLCLLWPISFGHTLPVYSSHPVVQITNPSNEKSTDEVTVPII